MEAVRVVELPPFELIRVDGDGQCGLHALRVSAKEMDLDQLLDGALAKLKWTAVPQWAQWTDDALGAVAIAAGLQLVIYSSQTGAAACYEGKGALKTIYIVHRGSGLEGHYDGTRIIGRGKPREILVVPTRELDAELIMARMMALSSIPRRGGRGKPAKTKFTPGMKGVSEEPEPRIKATPSETVAPEEKVPMSVEVENEVNTLSAAEREEVERELDRRSDCGSTEGRLGGFSLEDPKGDASPRAAVAASPLLAAGTVGLVSLWAEIGVMVRKGREELLTTGKQEAVGESVRPALVAEGLNQVPEPAEKSVVEGNVRKGSRVAPDLYL